MERLAIVARLKPGAEERAAGLIRGGPPFDLAASGLDRHAVYLSATEVVFVFEGHEAEWRLDDVVSDPFRWAVPEAFNAWRPLVEGIPRLAREAYFWERDAAE